MIRCREMMGKKTGVDFQLSNEFSNTNTYQLVRTKTQSRSIILVQMPREVSNNTFACLIHCIYEYTMKLCTSSTGRRKECEWHWTGFRILPAHSWYTVHLEKCHAFLYWVDSKVTYVHTIHIHTASHKKLLLLIIAVNLRLHTYTPYDSHLCRTCNSRSTFIGSPNSHKRSH